MISFAAAILAAFATFAQPQLDRDNGPTPGQRCRSAVGAEDPNWLAAQVIEGNRLGDGATLASVRAAAGGSRLIIDQGEFRGADLRNAELNNVCFVGTDLAGSDWRGARAEGLVFVGANLGGARLGGANMPGTVIDGAVLDDVDATGANLSGARILGGAWFSFERLRLDRANLTDFAFECGITIDQGCALQSEMSMREADLTGARLDSIWFAPDWSGARFDRTTIRPMQLGALESARIAGPLLVRGGDAVVRISPAEYARLASHLLPDDGPPSFDCARAGNAAERAICADDGDSLRALDRELDEVFRLALARSPAVAAEQRAWLDRRDRCAPDCLGRLYAERIDRLASGLGRPDWMRPGASALFVSPEIRFDRTMDDDPLYRRLVPALIGAASSLALVSVAGDSSLEAYGEAIGGNAHLCSLAGRGLRLDPASGWFVGPQPPHRMDPPEYRGKPMKVLRFRGDWAEIFNHGHAGYGEGDTRYSDYASCGARAGFDRMLRMPVGDAEVERMIRAFREAR